MSLLRQGILRASEGAAINLITNGTFDTDTDWVKNGTAEISGGVGKNFTAGDYLAQSFETTIGNDYLLVYDFSGNTGNSLVRVGISPNSFSIFNAISNNASGIIFTSTATTLWLTFFQSNFQSEYDNVSITEV